MPDNEALRSLAVLLRSVCFAEAKMSIKLQQETHKYLVGSIKRFFAEHMDDAIGDLKAALLLDFCVREVGPSIYNQAIADAQAYFQEKTSDLSGTRYEAEFDFWKK